MAAYPQNKAISVQFIQTESVQALASNFSATSHVDVPERYVRPELEADDEIARKGSFELPVIDLAKLRDPRFSQAEIAKLGYACREWGFFQLINHGVHSNTVEKVKADVTAFFNLPLEQKEAVAIAGSGMEGFGQHFVVSGDQKLDWCDLLYLFIHPIGERNFRFWPTNPPTFRETISEYSAELNRVTGELLEAMSKDLGIKPEVLLNVFEGQRQGMRMNYYPPCPQPEKVLGLSAHTDANGMTLLLHVNDVEGLQIRRNDKWYGVETRPGAFVVNIGDTLEIVTNGKYRSIEHRAVVNPTKERISVATFHNKGRSAPTIGPLPEIVGGGKENYRSLPYEEFIKGHLSSKLQGRNYLESLKISEDLYIGNK